MEEFCKKIEVRWSDLDPNFHMLHSKYYDLGGYCRMTWLVESGLTPEFMKQHHIGPILFREECLFKKEIAFGDNVAVNIQLQKATNDFSRWTMQHEIWISESILSALITCDGAWMDTRLRKLTVPPAEVIKSFEKIPKAAGFKIYNKEESKK